MAKNNGTWYFSFTQYNSFEKQTETKEFLLENQNDENMALQEANALWEKEKQNAENEFSKKKDLVHPPKDAFEDGPFNPALIYKISLR